MDPDIVASLLESIREAWPISNDLEITLEANPGSVEAGRFAGYAQAGVNRVSLGVQALNDDDLKRLGRIHSVNDAVAAFDIARSNFDRVSFDLIYGRQDQTLEDWRRELTIALHMAIDHLSLYQLTIENGTTFGDRHARGKLHGLPDEDMSADMYLVTQELCSDAGFLAYEVSNHAKPGAHSRHNMIYWRYGDYVGIGPGAHGRITRNGDRWATEATGNPEAWLDRLKTQSTETIHTLIDPREQAVEYVMMGLRLAGGIDLGRLQTLSDDILSAEAQSRLTDLELIKISDNMLFATPKGRMILNTLIKELLLEPQRVRQ